MAVRAAERRGAGAPPFEASLGWLCEPQNVAGPQYEPQPPGEASL